MLYKFMAVLFGNNDIYRYTPHPFHIMYSLLLMGVGFVTFYQGWDLFGVITVIFGIAMGLTIIIGLNWDKSIEYWRQIEYVLHAAAKIKDAATRYELLKSMGYNIPASEITVTERKEDEQGVFTGFRDRKSVV